MNITSDTWPFRVGQKVSATFVDHDGEHTVPAWVTLVYPARGGYGVVANTGEPRTLSFHVPANGRHDRIAPAA